MIKLFRFKVTPLNSLGKADLDLAFHITLQLRQEEFEDYQFLKQQIHQVIEKEGWKLSEICDWNDAPDYSEAEIQALKKAIGCREDAQLIPYHPHSYNHRIYRQIVICGRKFVYQLFSGDRFIKFAAAVGQVDGERCSKCGMSLDETGDGHGGLCGKCADDTESENDGDKSDDWLDDHD